MEHSVYDISPCKGQGFHHPAILVLFLLLPAFQIFWISATFSIPLMRLSSWNLCHWVTLLLMAVAPWQACWLSAFSYFPCPPLGTCRIFWISICQIGAEGDRTQSLPRYVLYPFLFCYHHPLLVRGHRKVVSLSSKGQTGQKFHPIFNFLSNFIGKCLSNLHSFPQILFSWWSDGWGRGEELSCLVSYSTFFLSPTSQNAPFLFPDSVTFTCIIYCVLLI